MLAGDQTKAARMQFVQRGAPRCWESIATARRRHPSLVEVVVARVPAGENPTAALNASGNTSPNSNSRQDLVERELRSMLDIPYSCRHHKAGKSKAG